MDYLASQGGDSQNFLHKFVRCFVTLGIKILRLFRLKVLFEADIKKGDVNYCEYLFSVKNYSIRAP